MFNIGGILSGVGDVAETTVRQGRRNKHDIEQINLRDKLARERQKEQYAMSRQEKFLVKKEARKERAKTLQLLGVTNPATVAFLSSSDSTLQMVQNLRNTLDARDEHTGTYSDINDYLKTTTTDVRGDAMRGEGQKITTDFKGDFSLSDFLEGDLDVDLPFQVSFAKKYLGKEKTQEERLAIKRGNWAKSQEVYDKALNGGTVEEQERAKVAMDKAFGEWNLLNESIKSVNAKERLLNLVQDKVVPTDVLDTVGKLEDRIKSRFNVLKEKTSKDDPIGKILQGLVLESFGRSEDAAFALKSINQDGTSQEDIDIVYNIIAKPILDAHFNDYAPEQQNIKDAVMEYFDRFITTKPEDIFYGKAFIQGEVPTPQFLKFLQNRGPDQRTIVQTGLSSYSSFTPNQEKLNEYAYNFRQAYDTQFPL
jgi:hypothetical protein